MDSTLADVPAPDASAQPDGFVVSVGSGERIHFLDWGGPGDRADGEAAGVVLVHGLSQTAWSWTPVARRLRGLVHTVAMDLRGHGLSDAPTGERDYEPHILGEDVIGVAEGSGVLADEGARVVIAGHGFGAMVGAWAAAALGERCAGLVLVDGGWEVMETATGIDLDEFLRGLDEPPEVMRSMASFLADRRGFDPSTWDDDQRQAAEATVVETHAGHVVPATRPHALEASVRTMFGYEPTTTLTRVATPVVALIASDDEAGSRRAAMDAASRAREAAGIAPIRAVSFGHDGHNLMRYRPREVAAAIMSLVVRAPD